MNTFYLELHKQFLIFAFLKMYIAYVLAYDDTATLNVEAVFHQSFDALPCININSYACQITVDEVILIFWRKLKKPHLRLSRTNSFLIQM